jgi:hypothetical protein
MSGQQQTMKIRATGRVIPPDDDRTNLHKLIPESAAQTQLEKDMLDEFRLIALCIIDHTPRGETRTRALLATRESARHTLQAIREGEHRV